MVRDPHLPDANTHSHSLSRPPPSPFFFLFWGCGFFCGLVCGLAYGLRHRLRPVFSLALRDSCRASPPVFPSRDSHWHGRGQHGIAWDSMGQDSRWDSRRVPLGPLGPLQRHKLHHFFWLQLSHSVLRFSLGMDMQLGMEMGMKRAGQGIAIAMAIAITTTVLCYAILYYTIL